MPPPAVSALSVDRGPEDGGTLVLVYGSNFSGATHPLCRFDTSNPTDDLRRPVAVRSSWDEAVAMPGGTYGPPPGTRTSGVNLGAAHEWAAAPTIVDATIAPPSAMGRLYSLRCYAPPHAPGYVPFDLTLNGKDYTSSGLLYHFYADNLTATNPTGGPLGGGTFYTCLLYTSPSPRDGLLSRMPSSA